MAAVSALYIVPGAYAWFSNYKDRELNVTGNVRRTYFERGRGTADDPYVIARPLQLYYLAWLQDIGIFNQDIDNDDTIDTVYFELGNMNGQEANENMVIDMSGFTLPPIGTTEYPFVGSFNGNGRTISGLTVSNDDTALSDMPSSITPDSATTNAPILGLFGVVGVYNDTDTTDWSAPERSVYDVVLEDITIDNKDPLGGRALAGIAAGYVNGVMENVKVEGTSTITNASGISAMSFENETRTALSDHALAGYCTEPYLELMKREDVKVYDPTVEISNLANYSEIGQGSAWGNTIDMHDMYNKLKSKYDSLAGQTSINYTSSKTITHNTDGTTTEVGGGTSSYQVTAGAFPVRMTAKNSGDVDSYAFIQRNDTEDFMYLYGNTLINTVPVTTTEIWKYESFYIKDHDTGNYLAVSSNAAANATTAETAGKWVFEQDTATGKYAIFTIDSNTKKYLTANNGSLGISTTAFSGWEVNAAKTSISVNDHYLCWNNTDGEWELCSPPKNYICDTAEGNYLSLERNGNTISFTNKTSASIATEWYIEPESGGYKISTVLDGARYSFYYDQTNDVFKPSADHHSVWYENMTETKNKLYVDAGGEGVHKALYYNSDEAEWRLTDYFTGNAGYDWGGSLDFQAFNARLFSLLNSGNAIYSTGNKYLAYYNGNDNKISVARGGSGGAQTYFSNNPNTNQIIFNLMGNGNQSVTFNKKTDTLNLPGTILPLIVNDDYSTSEKNTGYLVSGSESLASTNGTIRSASYQMRFISNSLDNANNSNIQVYDGNGGRYPNYSPEYVEILTNNQASYSSGTNGFVLIKDELAGKNASHTVTNSSAMAGFTKNDNTTPSKLGLTKYNSARKQMDDVLNGNSFIHGIHFWGQSGSSTALISTSNKITINDAWINGDNYNGYELLKNSVDFNLKETGKINLFAGSYYSRTESTGSYADSFLSLYKVSRSGNSITGVQRIDYIYYNKNYDETDPNSEKYIYRFNGASAPSGYTNSDLAFDMRYLTEEPPVKNALYYFEIPVNAGEYAMGGVTGKEGGAYLMYLDISTSDIAEGDAKIKSEGTAITATSSQSTGVVQISETQSRSENIETPPTYFPLAMNASGTNVLDSNTGYVVSGANYPGNDPPSDIRVSRYNRNPYISNSLTNGSLDSSKIFTIGLNGQQQTLRQYGTDRFYKYHTARSQLQETLDAGEGSVYGLHFMDAEISKDHLVTLPTATLNGQTYTNFAVPEDSIDFTLRTQGYINFFAGTYFSGSNVQSFFSLHQIFRNTQNEITGIKEIKEIYKNADGTSYTYRYDGESAPSSGTKVFDTAWLTNPSNITANRVYYFEIPVNEGEYALGSVAGKNGAYLLYLDISTHQGDSILTREKMEIISSTYLLPAGIRFSDDEYKAYIIPITQTGDIAIVSENGTVTSVPELDENSTEETGLIETVTISDYAGTLVVQCITEGSTVTYYYGTDTEHLILSTALVCSGYFSGIEPDTVILQYYYYPEGTNTVMNTASAEYDIADDVTVTAYDVTATADSAAVTAYVTGFDDEKSYLKFQSRNDLSAGDSVIIPVRSP
ncbi:hypothetical protein [Ruminococcus sp.]|uniref:hypothetical protein n=1 Tax=Ruminococcus sp. TaxID=41978 RepID=UPI00258EB025|nr:hypothetical protein [Ruminococcus sp.]MCR5021860.1 hypothetical protein [Ruminococcus sp.]